jgi:LuxR family maltose regulon positive regulatory protein
MSSLARLTARQGLLYEAEQTYRQALTLGEEGGVQLPWPSTGKAHIYFAELLYEWNNLTSAEQHVRYGIQLCEQWKHVYHTCEGMITLAKIQAAQGDLQEGIATFEHAKRLMKEATPGASRPVSIPRFRQLCDQATADQIELFVKYGDLATATDRAEQRGLSVIDAADPDCSRYETTLACLLVAQGRPDAAAALLSRSSGTTRAERWNSDMIKILVAWGAALEAAGSIAQATTILERALRLAEPGGYIRTFLDEGVRIQRVLSYLVSRGTTSAYVYKLLSAFREDDRDVAQSGVSLADPLSERELTVLHLLADGLSSPQIAKELIVAVSTVRTHIKHIYAKLDAHTSSEAVERARTLRLI